MKGTENFSKKIKCMETIEENEKNLSQKSDVDVEEKSYLFWNREIEWNY